MLSYLSFMIAALLVGLLRVRRPNVVVATSPQLLCACTGWVLARRWRVPFVFEVRDLWPESILAVGAMEENVVVRLLKQVARFLYYHADQVVTVGEGYRQEIHQRYGLPLAAMEVIPNGIDPQVFVPGVRANAVRRELGWDDRFVALYLGTLGMAHGLETVLDVAEALSDDQRFLFALVGEGAEKARLKAVAAERRLVNVQFHDQQPKHRVPEIYAACDLGLVTLRDRPLFRAVLPSKIFELMACERPILISVGGEARRLVEESGGGLYVPPEDAPAMAAAVRRLAADFDLAALGRAGRRFVLAGFSRPRQALRYRDLLARTIARRRRSAAHVP
jgi:glycosyltransferase involved in cell wall biosynthesis